MRGFVRSTPVAQTIVLRRVLTGGISANSGRRFFTGTQYGHTHPLGWWSWNGAGGVISGLVFGTLLGPETTGPGFPRDLCFWFPGCIDHARLVLPLVGGLVCGVCGTGLLFENYIVDASIFYKKQFPRI